MGAKLTIDLHQPAELRWQFTPVQRDEARELLSSYTRDLGLPASATGMLASVAQGFIREDHRSEMDSLASQLGVPLNDAVLGNLYYDAFKVAMGRSFGCTAFAVATTDGIRHARNLDWWTENSALARYTLVTRFINAPAGEFTTVGWPGFIGAFSGIAPGRFAVTLNAVLSLEPAQLATPVVFLIRTALEEAPTFEAALKLLSETPIPCDCLLLLTGTRPGELVVIERTPSRHAIRNAVKGTICVTNSYEALEPGTGHSTRSEIIATACRRLERITELTQQSLPQTAGACLNYLSDPFIKMNMTVQQMVLNAKSGQYSLG